MIKLHVVKKTNTGTNVVKPIQYRKLLALVSFVVLSHLLVE